MLYQKGKKNSLLFGTVNAVLTLSLQQHQQQVGEWRCDCSQTVVWYALALSSVLTHLSHSSSWCWSALQCIPSAHLGILLPTVGKAKGYVGVRGAVWHNLATASKTKIYRWLSSVLLRQRPKWISRDHLHPSSLHTASCWVSFAPQGDC